jgi:Tol biopolymer transport system component
VWIAYTGRDGNLYLLNHADGEVRQLTSDGTGNEFTTGVTTVQYFSTAFSSDGKFLAYRRDVGTPIESGLAFVNELWVYDVENAAQQMIYENKAVIGLAWKPGTHLLAYGFSTDPNYFTARGQVDSSLATGIWATDMDTTQNLELVSPQTGYTLVNPRWSRDGRYLAFAEVNNYEGAGIFSYYDFETQAYLSWNEPIGFFDWSPDSQTLVYDSLTYAPSGDERVYLRALQSEQAEQFSPDYAVGYAFSPRYSPAGDQIAYLAEVGTMDTNQFTLFVQPIGGGESQVLGTFENALYLTWLPDGSGIVFSAGPFEARSLLEVSLVDGAVKTLAEGDAPAMPQLPPAAQD